MGPLMRRIDFPILSYRYMRAWRVDFVIRDSLNFRTRKCVSRMWSKAGIEIGCVILFEELFLVSLLYSHTHLIAWVKHLHLNLLSITE